jgi:hypothetical protein
MKPFEMICGLVSPKSIGLINTDHINQLLKKFNLMLEISKLIITGSGFIGFCISGIPLIINSSFLLLFVAIFWSLLFAAFAYFTTNITFSQVNYFYTICLYLKLKLRNINNRITKNFDNKYKMTYYKMNNILKSLDSIISEINAYNNDFWSKYLMIFLISVIITLDLILFESIFGKMSLFFKIILIYGSSNFSLLLIILINSASSVSFEANKSYKLLNKLFITKNKQLSIRVRIKV